MSTSDVDVLYEAYVRYVEDAYREHERIGSRQSNFELRTGKARTRQEFQVTLDHLESNPAAKSRYVAKIQRGFHAEVAMLRERFQEAIGRGGAMREKQKAA